MRPGSLLNCRAWPRSPGLAFRQAGLALTGIETPRAFHGFNQRLGTNRRGSIEGRLFTGVAIEGSHRPFDLCAPSHLFAKRMTSGPVRALRLPVAGRCLLVGPCGFLGRIAEMLRIRFYNRRFASRAPAAKTPSSETARRAAVGKPAGVRLRDPPRARRCRLCSRKTPDHLAVIRPPTAPCLTARCRLRVERRPRRAFALHGESAAAFSAASRFAGRTL